MYKETVKLLMTLIRCALHGNPLSEEEKAVYSADILPQLISVAKKHDVLHLVCLAIKKNGLYTEYDLKSEIIKAIYRYENINYEAEKLTAILENKGIPFILLKGAVIRSLYPEPWMRTSGDVDVLVKKEDLETAIKYLTEDDYYTEAERTPHDVALKCQSGASVELHFDLGEEGRANNAKNILSKVWENAKPVSKSSYNYILTDEFFYFYHIAHMAKHFENGGCGIRPFIDLWLLDRMDGVSKEKRDELIKKGNLMVFAERARKLSSIWFDNLEYDEVSERFENFIISGGVYGSAQNRVTLNQKQKGGKIGYVFSRVFIPFTKLKGYYPILEKHRWLTPIMQIRRWFMLFKPDVAKLAKSELLANKNVDSKVAEETDRLLKDIGL